MTEATKRWRAKDRRMAVSGSVLSTDDVLALLQRLGVPAVLSRDRASIRLGPGVDAATVEELRNRIPELRGFPVRTELASDEN
jgi:hypothetical protein